MDRLKGKVAIVTGATSGIGRGVAEAFAVEGAAVIVGGRDPVRGKVVADSIRARGGLAEFVAADITTFEGNQALVAAAIECYGHLDIAVPNAGILGTGSVITVPLETWRRTIATNLDAVFFLARAAIPHMWMTGTTLTVDGGSLCGA
jgi:NAD(P)-dependent dehydrogenase (short-subunit alcohol dehydrogenase family)